jgi:transcriptional regulator with XRE-family HTH domain
MNTSPVTTSTIPLKNIRLFLSLFPAHISLPYHPKPRHWKSNQSVPAVPKTDGERIKKHRLELGLFQRDAAARIGISCVTLSDWERGITIPRPRMRKKIREFLNYTRATIPCAKKQFHYCRICRISESSPERCLFESVCKYPAKSNLSSEVHTTDPNQVRWVHRRDEHEL